MPEFFTAPLVVKEADGRTATQAIAVQGLRLARAAIWDEGEDDRSIIATHMHDVESEHFNPRILYGLDFDPDTGDILTRKGRYVEHPGSYACALGHIAGQMPTDDEMRWITATLVFAEILSKHPDATPIQKKMAHHMHNSLGKWRTRREVRSAMHAIITAEIGTTFADAMRPRFVPPYCHAVDWEQVFGSYRL